MKGEKTTVPPIMEEEDNNRKLAHDLREAKSRIRKAADYLRDGAPGKALEALEEGGI